MDGVLSTFVSKASRSRALMGHERTCDIQFVFGSDQVESRLRSMVVRTLCSLSQQGGLPVRCNLHIFMSLARTLCSMLNGNGLGLLRILFWLTSASFRSKILSTSSESCTLAAIISGDQPLSSLR